MKNVVLRWLEQIFRVVGRFAPDVARDVRGPEAARTFRTVCLAGFERHGIAGLLWQGIRECVDLAWTIATVRLEAMPVLRSPRLTPLLRDLRLAWRSLRHARTSSAIAVATLAVGIGVNAAVFSVLDATLWRQVPFRDAERLVEIWNFRNVEKFSYSGMLRPQIQEWRRQTDLFDRVEAFASETFIYETDRGAETVAGATVTPGTLNMLGVSAARGRTFAADEGRGGTSQLAVISDGFWRERLGSRSIDGGLAITLGGVSYRVIGVMPPTFRFPSGLQEVWIPYDVEAPPAGGPPRGLTPFARLAPGVTFDEGAREAAARGERIGVATGGAPTVTASLMRPGQDIDDRTVTSLWVLSGAVGFLFLIVCANVANLALSRSLSRARDLATCAAMGAAPFALVRTTVLEQLLLAAAGAIAGIGVAEAGIRLTVAALPDTMIAGTLNAIDLDMRALWFMVAAGTMAAMVCGLPPALMAARTSITGVFGGERSTTGSRQARRFRAGLAVVEVAMSVVLLIGAAVMARSFIALATQDQGYDTRGLISLRVGLPSVGYKSMPLRDEAAADIMTRIAALPGVTGVTVGDLPSAHGLITVGKMEVSDRPGELTPRVMLPLHEVPADYFRVMGIPIVAGRSFDPADPEGSVVVNQRFAAKYFPGVNAVGRQFRMPGKPWRTVIGVVGNTLADSETGSGRLDLFYPVGKAADAMRPSMPASAIIDFRTFLVRADQPEQVMRQLPGAVHARDASIVIWKTALVEHLLADAIARPRVVFAMMAVFASVGLVLAMVGLYGVLSCLVAQRRQELGVRLALGAGTADVRWLVMGHGLWLTSIGAVLGLAVAWPLVGAMRSLLYEVNPADPWALAGATALVAVTAMFSCWWPARDAGRISPVELLRR
ncbi:MAG TPA: ADOP family duplicated permease [Vicinamibacterales bacterium]|nr:ADOP family duplicated permease [Vicinamibacterales bacterium]